jgi:hypothetical protein
MRVAAIALLALWVACPGMAETRQDSIVAMLGSAKQEERAAGVQAALAIAPAERGTDLQLALDREFIRYVREDAAARPVGTAGRARGAGGGSTVGAKGKETARGKTREPREEDAKADAAARYRASLLEAISASTNPDLVAPLIRVADAGGLATDALARFGDLAVPGLVAAVRAPLGDSQLVGVLTALRTMTERATPLAAGHRTAIVQLVSDILDRTIVLQGPMRAFDVALAVEIGVATLDPGLRKIAEAIANNAGEAQRRSGTQDGGWLLQQRARDALERHPQKVGGPPAP